VGSAWGTGPKICHRIYIAIIRPMITHAAVVWWPRVELGVARAMLSRVLRLACLAITGAIRTSPTAVLQVITGFLPFEIHIKQVAMTTSYRMNILKNWKRVQNLGSHSHILEKMHKEVPFTGMRGDHMKTCFLFDKEFKITIHARDSWNKDQKGMLPENSRAVYTGGSGGPLEVGAGIYFGNLAEDQSIPFGKNVTVFQAETYAIQQCVSTLKSVSVTGELINIY